MLRIVTIGGGSGSFTLLKGLKKYTSNITAIFTMFDSGGSSGLLRDEFGYLPPGDIRRGLLALAPETKETKILRDLFNHRFTKGAGLLGHNFGNLLLTALKDITGDELAALDEASRLFNIKGKVLPISLDHANLCAELENGKTIIGETNIDLPRGEELTKIKRIYLDTTAHILPDVIEELQQTDIIVLGPGDLFTSLIPNLLVYGVKEAIQNSKAKKVYICNIMTKFSETANFTASDFINNLEAYLGKNTLTHIILNNKSCSQNLIEKYKQEKAELVEIDKNLKQRTDIKIIEGDFLSESEIVRHDSYKLAKAIIELN